MRSRRVVLWTCFFTTLGCGSETLDSRIKNVSVVGTRVASSLYTDGTFDVLVVPLDQHGAALLDEGFKVQMNASSPSGITLQPVATTCTRNRERLPLATGIMVDDSSSMASRDPVDASGPAPGRRAAVAKLVGAMQPGDETMLTDFFGTGANPLRDLVCVAASGQTPSPTCEASADSLTTDTAALQGAIALITDHAGTPLYEACLQMAQILAPQPHDRRAMVVLSDGAPNDEAPRAACLDAARSSNIRIFTIGYGGSSGVNAMRELSEATGGAYAAFTDQARLDQVVANMGISDGYCTVTVAMEGAGGLGPGSPVDAQIKLGTSGATASFEFLAPRAAQ